MYRKIRTALLVPCLAAALATLLLALLPLALSAGAEFLGKDVSGLASSIVSYYPWFFVRELLSVLAVVFGLFFVIGATFFLVAQSIQNQTGVVRKLIFPLMPLAFFIFLYLASMYEYPALYEPILPLWAQKLVFRSAEYLGPGVLRFFAVSIWLVAVGFLSIQFKKKTILTAGFVAAVTLGVAVFSISARVPAVNGDKPNILLISIDSLRVDHATESVMPELNMLMAESSSIVFKNHYVGIPRTFPSWMELLFARNAPVTSVRHMFPGFGDRRQWTRSLPDRLKEAGYRTSVVSDFAGDIFPRFEGGYDRVRAPSMNLRALIELAVHQKFPLFLPITTTWPCSLLFPALDQNPAFANPEKLVRRFNEETGNGPTPWFSTVFFSTAHFPYAVPFPFFKRFTDPEYGGPFFFQKNPEITGNEILTEENIAQTRGLYSGALAAIDAGIGGIFATLKKRGQWENTIVVVTGDHGEDLYEFGRLQGHGEHLLGKNVIKVPFVLKAPGLNSGVFFPGTTITRSIDIGPTILGAIGLNWPDAHGENLFPWMTLKTKLPPELLAYVETGLWFSATGKGDFQRNRLKYPGITGLLSFDHGMSQEIVLNPDFESVVVTAKHRAIIKGSLKLVYMPTESGVRFSLYDELNDVDNLNDLAEAQPAALEKMIALFFERVLLLEPELIRVGDFLVKK